MRAILPGNDFVTSFVPGKYALAGFFKRSLSARSGPSGGNADREIQRFIDDWKWHGAQS